MTAEPEVRTLREVVLDQLGTAESRAYKMWLPPLTIRSRSTSSSPVIGDNPCDLPWGSWMNRAAIYRMCGA